MKIVTYNIHYTAGTDGRYDVRPTRAAFADAVAWFRAHGYLA